MTCASFAPVEAFWGLLTPAGNSLPGYGCAASDYYGLFAHGGLSGALISISKNNDIGGNLWDTRLVERSIKMLVGYARTSTVEQVAGLDEQTHLLGATGCTRVFKEQVSSVAERAQMTAAIEFVRDGDTLMVCKLDRLARSTTDLLNIVATLESKGVALRILDFGGTDVDTQSATGRMLLTIMAAVAEAERTMMLERQKIGVAKAKADGRYRGRVPTARRQSARVIELRASGLGPSAIAVNLSISRASVYRILGEATA